MIFGIGPLLLVTWNETYLTNSHLDSQIGDPDYNPSSIERHSFAKDNDISSDIPLSSPKLCISSEGVRLWSESVVYQILNPDHIRHH